MESLTSSSVDGSSTLMVLRLLSESHLLVSCLSQSQLSSFLFLQELIDDESCFGLCLVRLNFCLISSSFNKLFVDDLHSHSDVLCSLLLEFSSSGEPVGSEEVSS